MKLVIFDCDGVLVDSEPLANIAMMKAIHQEGWQISFEETTQRFIGISFRDCKLGVEACLGRETSPEFERNYREVIEALFESELKPIPGIEEILSSAQFKYCLASSGSHRKIRNSLRLTKLLEYFSDEQIFSADDVARGKPYPDLFIHACERMGSVPSEALVIEDSIPGVQAGRAAGMETFAIKGYARREDIIAAGAKWHEDAAELSRSIQQWFDRTPVAP